MLINIFYIYSLKRRGYNTDFLGWGPLNQLENRLRVWMAMAGTGIGVGSDGLGGRQQQELGGHQQQELGGCQQQEAIEEQDGAIGGQIEAEKGANDGGKTAGENGEIGRVTADGNGEIGGATAAGNDDKWKSWRNSNKKVNREKEKADLSTISMSELEETLTEARAPSNSSNSAIQAGENSSQSP